MLKSLFSRLLTTYLIILVVVVFAISLFVSLIFSNNTFAEKSTELQRTADRVNIITNNYYDKKISKSELENQISSLGYVTDSSIYIIKTSKAELKYNDKTKIDKDINEAFILEDLNDILDGNLVVRNSQYSNRFGMYVVYCGRPVVFENKIIGAIFIFSPINEVYSTILNLLEAIWICAFIVIVSGSFVVYVNSKLISKPVKQMEEAARHIAYGEQVQDVHFNSIIEMENLAKSFNYMKNQLILTERVRKEFISNVSHDLRTPLTTIRGFLQGMLDGIVKKEDYNKYLNIIMSEVQRLYRLTTDILELAKIQSGSIRLLKENIHLLTFLNGIKESFEITMEEKSMELRIMCEDQIELYADRDRLTQIISNLVSNSIKYSNKNSWISIECMKEDKVVIIQIRDHGIGISKENLEFIFDKFYRVEGHVANNGNSSGIGLSIVKNLIDLHGGTIDVESEQGKGTIMTLKFLV